MHYFLINYTFAALSRPGCTKSDLVLDFPQNQSLVKASPDKRCRRLSSLRFFSDFTCLRLPVRGRTQTGAVTHRQVRQPLQDEHISFCQPDSLSEYPFEREKGSGSDRWPTGFQTRFRRFTSYFSKYFNNFLAVLLFGVFFGLYSCRN